MVLNQNIGFFFSYEEFYNLNINFMAKSKKVVDTTNETLNRLFESLNPNTAQAEIDQILRNTRLRDLSEIEQKIFTSKLLHLAANDDSLFEHLHQIVADAEKEGKIHAKFFNFKI